MRCFYCNKNEAVKSYERIEQGKKRREYYCLECYERLFLCANEAEGDRSLSACPYCGTTLKEFETSRIVGCPYCYRTMEGGIMPSIVKMQGGICGHRGKRPPLSEEDEAIFSQEEFATDAERDGYRFGLEESERFERQKKELETLIRYLGGGNKERESEYREKLERMKRTGKVEEEIVW